MAPSIWASSVLKEYLIKGYALNQGRLAEQGVTELRGVPDLLTDTLEQHQLTDETGLAVIQLVRRYGLSWQLLLQHDEDRLPLPVGRKQRETVAFDLAVVRRIIECLRDNLAIRNEVALYSAGCEGTAQRLYCRPQRGGVD